MKHIARKHIFLNISQPPSGGCVLKQPIPGNHSWRITQPPSGGCVLKPSNRKYPCRYTAPAAFGRLCVETFPFFLPVLIFPPAAFGRLCVETIWSSIYWRSEWSAAFGRLCVETASSAFKSHEIAQPPSGGCVLKPRCIAG